MTIVAAILIALGVAGSVLPFLPGPPLSFLGLLLYGFVTRFQEVSVWWLAVFGILTLLTLVLDVVSPALGARGIKASRQGVIGSIIGTIFGLFVLGPFGLLVGPFAGAWVGEYMATADTERSLKVAWGALVGFLVGNVARLIVSLAMAGYFVYVLLA